MGGGIWGVGMVGRGCGSGGWGMSKGGEEVAE